MLRTLGFVVFAVSAPVSGGAQVWIADDGERVTPTTEAPPTGGHGAHLFGLRGETLALQVAIRAGVDAFGPLTVDIDERHGLVISRFLVDATETIRLTRNGYSNGDKTLAWSSVEAQPTDPPIAIPDALIPISVAREEARYPLHIPALTTATIWFDIFIREDAEPGRLGTTIRVAHGGEPLWDIQLDLDVKSAHMPFRTIKTAVFYDPATLEEHIGDTRSELELWRLLHRHHLTPMLSADEAGEVPRFRAALDGTAYIEHSGYEGPGAGVGDDVFVYGSYGSLGEPSEAAILSVAGMQQRVEGFGQRLSTFLYAIDERCESSRGERWRRALRRSGDATLAAVRVGETCHIRAPGRAADLVMVPSASFRRDEAEEARAAGQWVWVYNGQRPRSGPMMVDVPPVDLRVNGWIASAFEVDRWFYWEAIFWNDINAGGWGRADPFSTTDSFHNTEGDAALRDGLLVYPRPGRSSEPNGETLFPSVRLKNLRRGIQDAGYVALAASQDADLAERVVRELIPLALDELPTDRMAPSWPSASLPFVEARRALWEAVPPGLDLDRDAVDTALAAVARARHRHIDNSPEDPRAPFAIAMLSVAAACITIRRAANGKRERVPDETKAFR